MINYATKKKTLGNVMNDIGYTVGSEHTAIPTCNSHHGLTPPSAASRLGFACATGLMAEPGWEQEPGDLLCSEPTVHCTPRAAGKDSF